MRQMILALAVFAAACSPPAENAQPSDDPTQVLQGSASSPTLSGHTIDAQAIIGTWSFDKSCASGDGMTLSADGVAAYDEWGLGTWRIEDGRLVLDLATQEMGVSADPSAPRQIKTFEASAPVTEQLIGTLHPDGRAIDGVRCP